MTKRTLSWVAFIGILALLVTSFAPTFLSTQQGVEASSHREAPLISQDPVADSTDLYAFVSPERPSSITLISNWIPFESPASGPNWYRFGDDVLYELHIDNVGDAQDHISFQFQFRTEIRNPNTFLYNTGPVRSIDAAEYNLRQYYNVTRLDAPSDGSCKNKALANCASAKRTVLRTNIPVAPANVGPKSFPEYPQVAAQAIADLPEDATKSFAGPRADSFYADIGSLFDLLTIRKLPGNAGGGVDSFASFNVHTLSLQLPIRLITKDGTIPTDPKSGAAVLGFWTTASRKTTRIFNTGEAPKANEEWIQVSRLGMPLVNEVVVPLGLKDTFSGLKPWQDNIPTVVNLITDPEPARLLNQIYGIQVPPTPRNDLVSVFATGVPGLNQPPNVVPSEQLRLNVAIQPSKEPNRLGVLAGDLAGFPNGRRLGDDVVDISLRVVAGVLVDGFNIAPNNQLGDGVDGPHRAFTNVFPYLATPYSGFFYYPSRATKPGTGMKQVAE